MRGLGTGLVLLLLVGATPACLLYTERINQPPVVSVTGPVHLFPLQPETLMARVTDPDGDAVTISWSRLDRPCSMVAAGEWASATVMSGPQYPLNVYTHDPFCVRVVAQDTAGAQAVAFWPGSPEDRRPEVGTIAVRPTATASGVYPLWSDISLNADSRDPDGDPMTFVWDVRDPSGDSVSTRCGSRAQPDAYACFTAELPGAYHATVTVSDRSQSASSDLTITVAEDQPPCLEATDPSIDTPELVLGVNDPPRPFEVRQVRDDGNPWPPGPHGASTFRWYLARDQGPFTRQIMFNSSTLPVGAGLFPGARPGDLVRVRVEARDPAHDSAAGVRDLDDCDDTRRICERPAGCARLVSWSVRLQ